MTITLDIFMLHEIMSFIKGSSDYNEVLNNLVEAHKEALLLIKGHKDHVITKDHGIYYLPKGHRLRNFNGLPIIETNDRLGESIKGYYSHEGIDSMDAYTQGRLFVDYSKKIVFHAYKKTLKSMKIISTIKCRNIEGYLLTVPGDVFMIRTSKSNLSYHKTKEPKIGSEYICYVSDTTGEIFSLTYSGDVPMKVYHYIPRQKNRTCSLM